MQVNFVYDKSFVHFNDVNTQIKYNKSKHLVVYFLSLVTISCDEKVPEKKYIMVVPDGGWGWLVLFGAMLVNILIPGGAIKSFGILFVEFIEAMPGTTPTQASWIPAICYFLYSSLGEETIKIEILMNFFLI